MGKRHELLSHPLARLTDIIRHDRDAAFEAMLITQSLEDPFAGMALLLRSLPVGLQDRIDNRNKGIKLRPLWRPASPVTRWR
jgi:hypothetical protein